MPRPNRGRIGNPNATIDVFIESVDGVRETGVAFLDRLDMAPANPQLDLGLSRELAIDGFLRVAVLFDAFRSEWHIAAISREPALFIRAIKGTSVTARPGPADNAAARLLRISREGRLTSGRIREVLDPLRRNLALGDGNQWRQRARTELAPAYASRVESLTAENMAIVAAVTAIRNCIAHRSQFSFAKMNRALEGLPARLRRPTREVTDGGIGRYLWASPRGQTPPRLVMFYEELTRIADALRV